MERILEGLEPEKCFYYFEEISRIPRSSYKEEAVSNYLVDFAKKRGLKVIQDEAWNVLISKPATPGYENRKCVMLQGHMDMVCVKDDGVEHDFDKDPIPMYIDGDYVRAHGTTLGADNATAVCLMLALLDSDDVEHPAIQCIFTSAEEVGLVGASKLDPGSLEGEYLLNLDGGHIDQLLLSSAGGSVHTFTIARDSGPVKEAGRTGLAIRIGGLTSGHSGSLSYRCFANANKLMGNVLSDLGETFDFELASLTGGIKMNAIAKEAKALLAVRSEDVEPMKRRLNEIGASLAKEYDATDPELHLACFEQPAPERVYSKKAQEQLTALLDLLQDGPFLFMEPEKNMAKTSNNIGIVEETPEDTVTVTCLMRSNSDYEHDELIRKTRRLSGLLSIGHEVRDRSSAWEFLPGCRLVELVSGLYEKEFGEKPKITMTHGGVEPGVIIGLGKQAGKNIQAVNFGVTSHGAHTTKEELYIPAMGTTYEWLKTVLKNLD